MNPAGTVSRAAARDIESFASQQLAEAEASEGFATAAEAAAGAAEVATAAEGGGVLAVLSERTLAAAGTVGAGGRPGRGGSRCCHRRHSLGHRRRAQRRVAHAGCHHRRRFGQRRLAALPRHRRADLERNAGKRGHRRTESEGEPQAQPQQQIRARPARRPRAQPQTPFALTTSPSPCPRAASASAGSPGATGGPWGLRAQPEASRNRPSTPFVRQANRKLPRYSKDGERHPRRAREKPRLQAHHTVEKPMIRILSVELEAANPGACFPLGAAFSLRPSSFKGVSVHMYTWNRHAHVELTSMGRSMRCNYLGTVLKHAEAQVSEHLIV